MMIKLAKIIECTGGRVVPGSPAYTDSDYIDNVVTDSRLLKEGGDYSHTAFLALKGEFFDGNDFIEPAVCAGVSFIVAGPCEEKARRALSKGGKTVIVCCEDTLKAYGMIAAVHRESLDINVIGITGSVGKTTAKEYVSKAVETLGKTRKTPKNHNNEIGVPRTVLGLTSDTKNAVIEMGMRGRGQISFLSGIARPHIGIITNIGTAHLELLGTMENTRLAKLEIADHMTADDYLLVNGDDALLKDSEAVLRSGGRRDIPRILTFGLGENSFFRGGNVKVDPSSTEFDLYIGGKFAGKVSLPVTGEHFVYSALAGTGAAYLSGATLEDVREKVIPALSTVTTDDTGRQRVFKMKKGCLIDDCYNASPEAVKAELKILERLSGGGRKVAFLGDMLELGPVEETEHRALGAFCEETGVDTVVCVGKRAAAIPEGAVSGKTVFIRFEDSSGAAEAAGDIVKAGDTVLVKGSHAMKMGIISDKIRELFEG